MSCKHVETNVYRVLKMCPNCPFKDNGKAMHLNDGAVEEIKKDLLENDGSFNCHKTVYNLDMEMNSCGCKQELKMCAGAYEFLKKEDKPNQQMRLAKVFGVEDGD